MDPLGHFLGGPRASRAFAIVMDMDGPWGIEVRDEAPLTVVAVIRGAVRIDGTLMSEGDVAVIAGPDPYLVTDEAGSAPSIRIDRDQRCQSLDGRDLRDELRTGVRRWGNTAQGATSLLIGTYNRQGDVGGLTLNALPRLAIVRDAGEPIVGMLTTELTRDGAAGQVVIDRLLDILVVSTIRSWTATVERRHHTWLTCDDPIVNAALAHLHADPAAPWTVVSLAERVAVSRATLAVRFRAGTGRSPMAYLTSWRLTLAGDLLLDPSATVSSVAHDVGYTNAYAFSTAFKRQAGLSPSHFRVRHPQLA